ncbi:FkbM family methyltransferase [Labrys neptuniae]
MPVSFAQALEDVLLFRALGTIESGFYIDVGANDPISDSVTKMFYDLGWSGINIEAAPVWHEKLIKERPRDINLNVAASDRTGTLTFHEIEDSGLSTSSADFAARHTASGFRRRSYDVQADTLKAICEAHVTGPIHFLKIDVEGAEDAVIRGADFKRFRPWIILVEATEPLSTVQTHGSWDPILTDAQYDFVIFDGLNRFYVAQEHPELKPFFCAKADDYERITAVWTRGYWENIAKEQGIELAQLGKELTELKEKFKETRESIHRLMKIEED